MRNILKPAARTASSRARRSVRGVAAVVASVALAAGLGSYPVDALETGAPTASAEQCTTSIETRTLTVEGKPTSYATRHMRITVSGLNSGEKVHSFSANLSSGSFDPNRADSAAPLQDKGTKKLTTFAESPFPNYSELATTKTVTKTDVTYDLGNPIAVGTSSGDVDLVLPTTQSNAKYYTVTADVEAVSCEEEPTSEASIPTTDPTEPADGTTEPTDPTAVPTDDPAEPSSPAGPTTNEQPPASTSSVPLDDETKRFDMEGRGGIRLNPATTTGESPYETTATVDGNSTFSKAVVRISAPNSILASEAYSFHLDKTETGVSFERRVVSISRDYVEFEVYPVKNGQRVDSVQVPDGAKFTMTSGFSDNPPSVDAVATIYGTSLVEPKEPVKVSPPDGADWVEKQYPNPEMPKKCGLKIAIVADQSRSLQNADVDGFEASRNAANEMVKALVGAPGTKVGIYNFASRAGAKGTTKQAVDVSVNGVVNPQITNAINEWTTSNAGNATNWEAGLKQVQNQGYDIVYFITDGMPTYDDTGWQNMGGSPTGAPLRNSGAFVQERSLNQAILAANELKKKGTRVVPIMVDLTLAKGNVVTQEYVLKNLLSTRAYEQGGRHGNYLIELKSVYTDYPNWQRAAYRKTQSSDSWDLIVNLEEAVNAYYKNNVKSNNRLIDIVSTSRKTVTNDKSLWTYGTRTVKQMGEDISGPGDTVRVEQYSQLADQLKQIASEINQFCEGKIIVQKQIVDANGGVLTDGADGWEFSVMANNRIIDTGNGDLVYADSKTTATEEGADKPQASWNLVTDRPATATITEHQQEGYKLYQRDEKNAVCTQNLNGKESQLEVQNTGATGFRVPVNTSGSHVATVVCVVANTKADQPNFGLEVKKVDLENRDITLSEAEFEVREVTAVEGEAPQTWTLETGTDTGTYTLETVLEPGKEYDLVEVKAPTQDGVVYSLLTAPVRFRGSIQDQGVAVEYQSNGKWVSDISTQGVWNVVSDKQTAYLEVANVRQGNMPKTGGAGVQLPILLGGTLIAAGALMGRRKVAA
ncbi:LPXTG cell wall anchor domain-containing protein [Corynebacterium sp. HMSC034A01]|uniref:LPXTG cell wall anchor domain-containing protein n=1 Tax=Corynebacterium sp. HMSC034A01 TaxID=1739295 RepID=UPI0008A855EE|nr:LPXTG cell wall anchor domain-containing protein [Corynebacterium sp. HMSC034A01]OHR24109.1 hypothetical protein HMPREF2791_04985 [Corynebacterium sp. HMSC034A01]